MTKTFVCEHLVLDKEGRIDPDRNNIKNVGAYIPLGEASQMALCHICWARVYASVCQQIIESIGRGIAQDPGFRNLFRTVAGSKTQKKEDKDAPLAS